MTSKAPTGRDPHPGAGRGSGFQARIRAASLADLVQMECLGGSRRIVRVTSGDQSGYLYFRGGAVVHAATRSLVGEEAAMAMLAWNEGTFEPFEREWPAKDTIACGWQTLLIRAAQVADEKAHEKAPGSSVVPLPRPRAKSIPGAEAMEFQVTPIQVAGHSLRGEDFSLFLRMNRDGVVVASHPSQAGMQAFADMAAYALRLAHLIGDQLGIERFVAMECTFNEGHCFIVHESGGDVVALKPQPSTDVNSLRELLGV